MCSLASSPISPEKLAAHTVQLPDEIPASSFIPPGSLHFTICRLGACHLRHTSLSQDDNRTSCLFVSVTLMALRPFITSHEGILGVQCPPPAASPPPPPAASARIWCFLKKKPPCLFTFGRRKSAPLVGLLSYLYFKRGNVSALYRSMTQSQRFKLLKSRTVGNRCGFSLSL